MPQDAPPTPLGLEDLLSAEMHDRLRSVSPGIGWALDSLVVSFGAEIEGLDPAARDAFARLTLGYGEHLTLFLRLAQEGRRPEEAEELLRRMALLRHLDLFSELNEFDLGQIAMAFESTTLDEGQELARQGAEGEAVYFIDSGSVGVIVDGNQVAIRGAGTLFGETSVITNEPVNATLRCISRCAVLQISRADFIQSVLTLPEIVAKIARIGFTRLEEATHRLSEVLGHMPDALLKIDREGLITGDVSSKCFQYLGRETLTGFRFAEVFFKDQAHLGERWEAAYPVLWDHPYSFQDDGFDIPRSAAFALSEQNVRHYELNLFPCYRRGVQEGFDVAIADLTDHKRIEEERARMQRALQRRQRKFVLFQLSDARYGVEIEKVREIIEAPRITRTPNAPPFLLGFFNLRGHIIPALDCYSLLGLPQPAERARGSIFIVEVRMGEGKLDVGLVTDGVDHILDVYETDITAAADIGIQHAELDYLYGVATAEEQQYLLLDVDGLVSTEQISELGELQPAE